MERFNEAVAELVEKLGVDISQNNDIDVKVLLREAVNQGLLTESKFSEIDKFMNS